MNIEDLTIREVQEIQHMFGGSVQSAHGCSLEIGKKYLIRCVTHFQVGLLTSITDSDLVLSDASWVADTGRFSEALLTGDLSEIEPFPNQVVVSRGAIVDVCEWTHKLPREKK
jgi:hypothetical protein